MRLLLSILLAVSGSQAFAAKLSQIGCYGNLAGQHPKLSMSQGQKVSDSEIKQVMELLYGIYADEFMAHGLFLRMNFLKEDAFNAYARQTETTAEVMILSGLGIPSYSTTDLIALVTCHEIGHHLGGLPRYSGHVMSTEGQADYFAGVECMRRYLEVTSFTVPLDIGAVKTCKRVWRDSKDIEICARTVGAGQATAKIFAGNNVGIMQMPDLTRRNASRVSTTYQSHPEAQCRLDTYAAGALCTENYGEPVAQDDVWTGVCSEERGDRVGVRPRCWYAPLSIAIPR